MKKNIISIFVFLLLIATVLPVLATQKAELDEAPSCRPATTTTITKTERVQIQKNIETSNKGVAPFYGYCVWDPSGTLVQGPVYFYPTDPGTITQIASTSSNDFISGGTWTTGKWFCCEFAMSSIGEPWIWRINPVIGEMTQVVNYDPEGTGLSFNGLAYDNVTHNMYGCSSSALYKVDMITGSSSLVGNFSITNGIMIGITFDGSGNLYGTEVTTDSLYSINPANGIATKIGNGLGININYAQDMAFDIDNGILYLSAYISTPGFREGALYICDTTTGIATKVGTFQGGAEIDGFAIPYNYENKSPYAPTIDGPTSGKPGIQYNFTLNTTDPESDDLSYYIDWGDKKNSGWLGPYKSGEIITVNHTWDKIKLLPYTVKAKARDTEGAESNWTILKVKIPINQQSSQQSSKQMFGLNLEAITILSKIGLNSYSLKIMF
jgi:hypothetical protein